MSTSPHHHHDGELLATLEALQTEKVRLFDAMACAKTGAERTALRAQFRQVVAALAQLPPPQRAQEGR